MMPNNNQSNMIIYNTPDGKTSVSLYANDGMVWMTQNQLAELFDTSKQNISHHVNNIIENKELIETSVVKEYLTTANDGHVDQESLEEINMIEQTLNNR